MMIRLLILFVALSLGGSPIHADEIRPSGVLYFDLNQDEHNQVLEPGLPSAKVTLIDGRDNAVYEAVTAGSGWFVSDSGSVHELYTITIEHPCFSVRLEDQSFSLGKLKIDMSKFRNSCAVYLPFVR